MSQLESSNKSIKDTGETDGNENTKESTKDKNVEIVEDRCVICCNDDENTTWYITQCIHKFCILCILKWTDKQIEYKQDASCPTCRTVIDDNDIKYAYKQLIIHQRIQNDTVQHRESTNVVVSSNICTYEQFLFLNGVDVVGDKFIILDMVPSNEWITNLQKVLKISINLSSGSRYSFFDVNKGLFVRDDEGFEKQIIFKLFNKKMHIKSSTIYVELSERDIELLDRLDDIINKTRSTTTIDVDEKCINGYKNLTVCKIDGSDASSVSRRRCLEIKLRDYNAYCGDEEISYMGQFSDKFVKGDVAFHMLTDGDRMFSAFDADRSSGRKFYANAIEINMNQIPTKYITGKHTVITDLQ